MQRTDTEQFWRMVAVLALVLCAALIGERYLRTYLYSATEPRPIAERSDLTGSESHATELFAATQRART